MPALTTPENAALFAEMHALPDGPERAAIRARIIEGNLPFARDRTKHFLRDLDIRGRTFDDFLSYAHEAMVDAVDDFDPGRGFAFSTYAASKIWGYLSTYRMAPLGLIRLPRHHLDLLASYRRAVADGTVADRKWPGGIEDADRLHRPAVGIPLGHACRLQHDDDDSEAEAAERRDEAAAFVGQVLDTFEPRDREILKDMYGLDGRDTVSLNAIPARHGVRRSHGQHRIQQFRKRLRAAALGKLVLVTA